MIWFDDLVSAFRVNSILIYHSNYDGFDLEYDFVVNNEIAILNYHRMQMARKIHVPFNLHF